jgi:hypothetical protein
MTNDLSAYSTVTVTFDKAVDKATAENKANYGIVENSVPISLANILPANITLAGNVVTIQLNTNQANPAAPADTKEYADHQLTPGTGTLAVTVSGVKDINGNVMAAAQTVTGNISAGTTTAPDTVSASGLTPTKIEVEFNEALRSVKASDFKVEVSGIDNPVVSAELKGVTAEADRKFVILTVTNPIGSGDYDGNKVQVKGGTTATDIKTVSGVALTTFTQRGVAAFRGTEVTATVAQGTAVSPVTFTKSKTGVQVSDTFKITMANGIAHLRSVEFTLSGDIDRTQLENFRLYYNTSDSIANATLLGTVASVETAATTLTFNGLNRLLTADANNFVFVTADSRASLVDGKTFKVEVEDDKFKVLSGVTGFEVISDGTAGGTQITSDIVGPELKDDTPVVLAVDKGSVTIEFKEEVINNLADAAALKAAITFAADGSTFTALGNNDAVEITVADKKVLKVTFDTALSTATNKIKIAAGALKDAAGNVNVEITTSAIDAS